MGKHGYSKRIKSDKILYRIWENLIGNAVSSADQRIKVDFAYHQGLLTVTVSDDGPGFPQKVLSSTDSYAYMGDNDENHLGMGLSICQLPLPETWRQADSFKCQTGRRSCKIYLVVLTNF